LNNGLTLHILKTLRILTVHNLQTSKSQLQAQQIRTRIQLLITKNFIRLQMFLFTITNSLKMNGTTIILLL